MHQLFLSGAEMIQVSLFLLISLLWGFVPLGVNMTQQIEFEGITHDFPDDFTQEEISSSLASYDPNTVDAIFDGEGTPGQGTTSAMVDGIAQPEIETISAEEEAELFPDSDLRARDEELPQMNTKVQGFRERITSIETGGLDETFIRTGVRPKEGQAGSSAYGPVQITRGLIGGYLQNKRSLFNEKDIAAMNELAERQRIGLKIGGSDIPRFSKGGSDHAQAKVWAKRYGYDTVDEFLTAFDYGGDYGLAGDADFELQYESFSRKMLADHLKGAKGDEVEAASRWHGGMDWSTAKSKGGTKAYRKKYESLLNQ